MTDVMKIGVSGLLAYQRAIATVGNNVSNSTTPGYSRQRIDMESVIGGRGVVAARLTRLADSLVLAQSVDSSGELGRLTQLSGYSTRMDKLLTDKSTGIGQQWNNFFASAQGIVNSPSSSVARSEMISSGQQLGARWNAVDRQLAQMESDVNSQLDSSVATANRLMSEITGLNRKIVDSGSNPAPELLDKRAGKMEQLATLVGGTIVEQGDGNLNLFSDTGIALVLGSRATTLTTSADPYLPGRMNIAMVGPSGPASLPPSLLSGEIGGLLEFRGSVLDPARNELDRQAYAFATAFNQQHASGVDSYGNPGGDFFNVAQPTTLPHSRNTGSASISAEVTDLGGLTGRNVEMKFKGGSWTAWSTDTGKSLPLSGSGSAADPFVIDGMQLTVSGSAAEGDSFLVTPTRNASASLQMAFSDPDMIAVAAPLTLTAGVDNQGSAYPGSSQITDPAQFTSFGGANIQFIDATHYSIDGAPPVTWTSGDSITGPGWSLKLEGTPQPGDSFAIAATLPSSADNGNARLLAELGNKGILAGGSMSLSAAQTQMTARSGSVAQLAQLNFDAQTSLHTEVQARRESLSGVNLEEEAGNLMMLQKAYSAAAQIIGVADDMFQTVLSAVRR